MAKAKKVKKVDERRRIDIQDVSTLMEGAPQVAWLDLGADQDAPGVGIVPVEIRILPR
jgi:hypothetical protein